MLLLKTE